MSYLDYETLLDSLLRSLSQGVRSLFVEESPMSLIKDTASDFNLVEEEVGELCELVRRVIVKELPVEKFEESLKSKLSEADDEDNLPRVGEIVSEINDKIFVKLLPALGMKALPITLSKATVTDAGVQFSEGGGAAAESAEPPQETAAAVPLKKFPPATPPQPASKFMIENVRPAPQVRVMPVQPKPKPPIMEVSHERMSDKPLDSFLKMLSGRLSDRELQSRFDKLPYTLKTALRNVDSAKKVVDIGRKYALHVDKLGDLGAETGLVILGITHPAQYLPRLTKKLGLSEEKVRPIAQEINTEIFLKIREALKQINPESPRTGPSLSNKTPERFTGKTAGNAPLAQTNYRGQKTPGAPSLQAPQPEPEENLNRDEILRDIENPSPSGPTSKADYAFGTTPAVPPLQNRPAEPASPAEERAPYEIPAAPPQDVKGSDLPMVIEQPAPAASESPSQALQEETAPETAPSKPELNTEPTQAPPTVQTDPTENMIDRKLSGTVASQKSESQYTMDPYREAIE